VFNNFGPSFTYDSLAGWLINYPPEEAFAFIPVGNSYSLTSIALAVCSEGGVPAPSLGLELTSDSSGHPGAVLESWTSTATGVCGSLNPPVSDVSVLHPSLIAGDQYWLVANSIGGESLDWNWNSIGDLGLHAFSVDYGSTWILDPGETMGAFEIVGSPLKPVPEPRTLLLVGSCLAGLLTLASQAHNRGRT
jgi:hypothetical protein